MIHTGYLTWILLSWALTVVSVKTLPHVLKYQTVMPRKLKDSSVMNQKYPDMLRYSLTIEGQNVTLHLEKNIDLIGKNFSVTHYSDEGTQVTTFPDLGVHCYYHGHIVGVEASSASVGLCSGIKGFLLLWDQMYLIEPLASHEAGQEGDGQSSHAHSDESPHIVYNYKHLRRKRRSCSHGKTATYYDHGARLSGLLHPSSVKSAQTKAGKVKSRTVELVLVSDHTEYKKFNNKKTVETRMLEIANHVDKLYRPVGIRVMLVGVYIWSYRDEIMVSRTPELTLDNFLSWRQKTLLPRIKHDNAQFVTGVDFEGSTVGLANTNAMCTSKSGGVNEDHNINPIGVASTVAHEMGHNLGLTHDTASCVCGSSTKTDCIMAERIGLVYPKLFSSCSLEQLKKFLNEINPACLLDTPSTDRIYGGPVCGNAFVEHGEECDCGTRQECKNPCCNATTCKLTAGAQCAEGECCHNCQLKPTGSVCRPKAGDCDLAEHCTGFSASCPTDAYAQNGLLCNSGKGYCYNGECPSKQDHCKRLWGPDADVATSACSYIHENCRQNPSLRCLSRDIFCGTLFCTGGWEYPVTSRKSFYSLPNGETCNQATMNPEDNYPADLAMVPTGTKCGTNMVCYNQRCRDLTTLKMYASNDCADKCNNKGVCDHESKCHCNPGWAPPFCQEPHSELPKENIMVIIVPVAVGLLLLSVLVTLSVTCYNEKRRSAKRCLQSSSGQLNPVFRSSSTRGSPRLGNSLISQPTFVESSATQHCKPLPSAVAQPHGVALQPSRAAPLPPKTPMTVPAVHQPSNIQQVARPFTVQPSAAINQPSHNETKPLPPSRPLPPLTTKPPKPPVPPVKPKPSTLPHTQLLAGKTALLPPSRPR